MSIINSQPLIGASGSAGYQINRSARIRSSASAYFSRTPSTAGNRTTWTWSAWVKRGALGGIQQLFTAGAGVSTRTVLTLNSSNALQFYSVNTSDTANYSTTQLYRDPAAWYHIVCVLDTTQATATDRLKIYVNNTLQTLSVTTTIAQNAQLFVNHNSAHAIGRESYTNANFFDGYITEVHLIDGQALTPASFGETDVLTGVWKPKKYNGTYGTNGFYLNFSDNSAATAAAIGKDYSGNGNNWTPNNISVTAGATYDSMLDVPTQWADGGNGRGNYAVMNPIKKFTASQALTNGNLTTSDNSASMTSCVATMSTGTSGKYYFECTMTAVSASTVGAGSNFVGVIGEGNANGNATFTNGSYRSGNPIYNLSGGSQTSGATYTTGDVIGVAVDVTNGTVQFYKNNVAQGSTPSFTFTAGTELWPFAATDNVAGTKTFDFNFGQRPFSYTPPSGFKALNTQNLPDPTIKKGNQFFDATAYTGNGATQSITNSGSMQPDLVWFKRRSASASHVLVDSVRGNTKNLFSNLTDAEQTQTEYLTSFDSGGFSLGDNNPIGTGDNNVSAATYIAWQWKKGATQGFDIVTYTGNGTTQNISHNLGVKPAMVITKGRNTTIAENWNVWHKSLAAENYFLRLNTTDPVFTTFSNRFTAFSSTTMTVGNNSEVNENGKNYISLVFSEVAVFSKFGSYTGNGSTDGPMVWCGFKPRFILWKRTDAASSNWCISDAARTPSNLADITLYPNLSGAESVGGGVGIDYLSNGFKIRNTNAWTNASGGTYIFAAFAENPTKYALAR